LIILIAALLFNFSFAAEPKVEQQDWETFKFLDQTQRFISNQWIGLNYNLDTFFSNENYKLNQNQSLIMAYYGVLKKESAPAQYAFDLRVKIHLPKTTSRMRIVVEKERDEIAQTVNSEAGIVRSSNTTADASGTVRNSNYIAGLTYLLTENKNFQTFLDSGMRIVLPLDPYIKLRVQKNIKTSWVNIFASQGFFLFRQDGFQEITQLSFFRKINNRFQLELINTLSWTDRGDAFAERNNLILYHQVSDTKSLSYSAGANAKLSPTFYYDSYDASINYRQLIHKNWLFMFLSVGAEFFKEHDFQMEKFVQARLEVFFR
jgi:hypothetical protein